MINILRFKQLLVTAALLLVSISSFAYDFEVDGIYYNKLSENTVEVTYEKNDEYGRAESNYSGIIKIPSSITVNSNTYNVTSIGDYAFYHCSSLTSITIPDDVTSIGYSAFEGCSGLASITIPDGVTSIGGGAFSGCRGLTSIKIPDGVTSIGKSAFMYCSGLTSIKIPDGVTSIGDYAFDGCSGLTSIKIPDGVTSIGNSAFDGCFGLTSITISDGVTSIGNSTFSYCSGLTSITIPDGVTSIGYEAFYGCSGLTSIKIPDGVTSIGGHAFWGCSGLTSINIPDGVTSIGGHAFSNCYNLKDVNIYNVESWLKINIETKVFAGDHDIIVNGLKLIDLVVPESITTIGKYSFANCTSLESITFHKDVTTIVQNAFNGCKNVKKIVCQGDTPPVCGAKALEGISRTDCTLYVPETSNSNYKNTAPWNEFTNIVGGGTDTPDTPKTCEAPTITFDNDAKKLVFTSATDGATYVYTVTSDDMASETKSTGEATMTGVYNITAYASAEGMYNSEKTTAKLCWVSAAIESDGIMNARADRGVVVSSNGDQITISGTVSGETIEVYNVGGSKVKAIKATGDNTTISGLMSGNVYIVKIGGSKVKVAM